MRKSVHKLAHAFKLNIKSKNSGDARFATLMKTTLSGVNVDVKATRSAQNLGKSSSYEASWASNECNPCSFKMLGANPAKAGLSGSLLLL
jgi:hypothetical protein